LLESLAAAAAEQLLGSRGTAIYVRRPTLIELSVPCQSLGGSHERPFLL